jgi:hypothetical protein
VWSALWDTTGYSEETPVTITVTATDSALQEASNSIAVTVNNTVQEMSVASLTSRVTTIGRSGKWQAYVTATIVDSSGSALSGATVSGNWTGAYTASGVSGITDSNGSVTLATAQMTSGSLVTFTVTDVALDGYAYDDADPSIDVALGSARSKATAEVDDLDAMYRYLAGVSHTNKQQSDKKDADDQVVAVDLLMAYGL